MTRRYFISKSYCVNRMGPIRVFLGDVTRLPGRKPVDRHLGLDRHSFSNSSASARRAITSSARLAISSFRLFSTRTMGIKATSVGSICVMRGQQNFFRDIFMPGTIRDIEPDHLTPGSPHTGPGTRYAWLIPVLVAIAVYYVGVSNYFTYDDFIWLNRARTFKQDWLQIFRPDVTYFDPIVHLMFLGESMFAGLNHQWYHGVDLAIHGANSLLAYRLARLISGDRKAALYSSILFAGSFAIADAVLWSSSRVDLVSTLCSFGVMIQFLLYLRGDGRLHIFFSFLLFILALGAKGTPLVLPLILFLFMIQEEKPLRQTVCLVPFGAVVVLYLLLLKLTMHQASLPLDKMHFNVMNGALAFCALFIPEAVLSQLDLASTALLLFAVVSGLGLLYRRHEKSFTLRKMGFCILVVALLPVLVLNDFKLVTGESDSYLLLVSPSHRIYLASVGAAFWGGGCLRAIETAVKGKCPRLAVLAVVMLLAAAVIGAACLVRQRAGIWKVQADMFRAAFEGLSAQRQKIAEGSQIALINFPGSRGFETHMIQLCSSVNDFTLLQLKDIGIIEDPEVLRRAERSLLFVLGSDGHVYDKSLEFRQQLYLTRMAIANPNRPEYASACKAIASTLQFQVHALSGTARNGR